MSAYKYGKVDRSNELAPVFNALADSEEMGDFEDSTVATSMADSEVQGETRDKYDVSRSLTYGIVARAIYDCRPGADLLKFLSNYFELPGCYAKHQCVKDLLKAIFAGVFSESKVIGIDKFVGFLTAWKGSKEQAAFMTTYPLFLLDDMYNKITRRPLCNIVPEDTTPEEVSKFVHDNLRVLENMRPPNDDETDEEEDEEDEEGEDELEKGHKRPKSESSGLRREKREKEKTRQLTIHGARYGWGNDLWHNIDPKHPKGVKDVTDIVVADMENNELNTHSGISLLFIAFHYFSLLFITFHCFS